MALTAHNVKDNWYAALDGAINDVVTSLVIDGAGAGAEPTAPFYFNIDSEQLLCTAVATNTPTAGKSTLTVTRGQNSTTAASHSDNATVQQLINAAQITELNAAVKAIQDGPTAVGATVDANVTLLAEALTAWSASNLAAAIMACSRVGTERNAAIAWESNDGTKWVASYCDNSGNLVIAQMPNAPNGAATGSPGTMATFTASGGLTVGNSVVASAGALRQTTGNAPASAGAAGSVGQFAWDANYLYICTATNTWRRIAHNTW